MLAKYVYAYYSGEKFEQHIRDLVFDCYRIPFYDKAVDKKECPITPHFRLVFWDITIDKNGNAILIEPNMRKGAINIHQFSNGSLFGKITDIIMIEVFGIS